MKDALSNLLNAAAKSIQDASQNAGNYTIDGFVKHGTNALDRVQLGL